MLRGPSRSCLPLGGATETRSPSKDWSSTVDRDTRNGERNHDTQIRRGGTASTCEAPLFAHIADEVLLGYGVPTDWLKDVRQANEDSILDLAEHLPGEAAEALLNLATGKAPLVPQPAATGGDPFEHPDAQRRFRVMGNVEELERALEYPWEKWSVFLHPAQRELVKGDYSGPVRVSGSAGTGKTIVALHRAVHLARIHPDARVLLTTFSDTLSNALLTTLFFTVRLKYSGHDLILREQLFYPYVDGLLHCH